MILVPISDTELTARFNRIEKDGMSVFIMAEGKYRGAFFHGTRFINQMKANHQLGILETMILGQAYLCTALMIPTMKDFGRLSLRYDTNGPAAGFVTEADSTGNVRGYLLQDPVPVTKPLESWDLAPFFGPGTLTVSRIHRGDKMPHTGSVEIKYQNIAQDLTWYFAQSEQIHTAFNTSIQLDKQGRVIGAGGMFLQRMPDAGGTTQNTSKYTDDDYLTAAVEHAFSAAPSYGQWFAENGSREDIIFGLFREFEPSVILEREIRFNCPCSEEHFRKAVKSLSKTEFDDIIKHDPDPLELVCHYCGSIYHIFKENLLKP